MKTTAPRQIALVLALAPGLAASVFAQTAPPNPPDSRATSDEQAIVLETFTVNTDRDRGYVAVDSLAGGRTNTPIKLTPATISSITRTFIDDLAIQDVREALRWSPNVVPEDMNAGKGFGGAAFHDWAYNYRGAGAGEQGGPGPNRNYFSFYQNQDSYNIERIEFLRGPNSIIFGLGTVGGTLSSYTKVPRLDRDFLNVTTTFDNNGSTRYEADLNRGLNQRFVVRVNALYDQNRGWREGDRNDKTAVDVAFLYKLSSNTTVRLELEGARYDRTLISSTIGDKLSGWDGTTASNTWGAAPTGSARTTKIQNAGAWGDWLNPFWVYVPSLGAKGLMPWAGGYASTNTLTDAGSALNWQPHAGWYPAQIKLPWETAYSPTATIPVRPSRDWTYGQGRSEIEYKNLTAFVDQKLNENIDVSLSFFRYLDEQTARNYEGTGGAAIDINKQLPDGTANPNFGKPYADFFLSKQVQTRANTEARAQLNYHFDATLFGASWKQLFSVSASYKDLTQTARQYLGQVGNGTTITNPADWVQNMVWGRIYLDQPNHFLDIPEVINGRSVSYLPKADGYWFDFDDHFKLKDYAVMSQSRLFDDALSITLGARRDTYTEDLRELRRGPNLSDRFSHESESGNTYSAGAVYYFHWLGFFANYSKNIQPPHAGSQPFLNGERPDPEEGKGLEYGVRVSTGDGKYSAALTRYDTKSVGHLVENPVDLRGIWQKYNITQGRSSDSGNGSLAFSDTTSLDVTGWELDVTANPTRNLRLQLTYAKPETEIVDYYPMSREHFAANVAAWNAAAGGTSQPAIDLRNAVAGVQDKLNQSVTGAKQQGQVDYTASFFATYSFLDNSLKGLSLGGGFYQTGKAYLATYDGTEYFGTLIRNATAMIAYETKLGKVKLRLALNVDNVLGRDNPIVTSYHWGYADQSGRHIRDGYLLPAPRTYRLSARFSF